jgi:hypothetical protein
MIFYCALASPASFPLRRSPRACPWAPPVQRVRHSSAPPVALRAARKNEKPCAPLSPLTAWPRTTERQFSIQLPCPWNAFAAPFALARELHQRSVSDSEPGLSNLTRQEKENPRGMRPAPTWRGRGSESDDFLLRARLASTFPTSPLSSRLPVRFTSAARQTDKRPSVALRAARKNARPRAPLSPLTAWPRTTERQFLIQLPCPWNAFAAAFALARELHQRSLSDSEPGLSNLTRQENQNPHGVRPAPTRRGRGSESNDFLQRARLAGIFPTSPLPSRLPARSTSATCQTPERPPPQWPFAPRERMKSRARRCPHSPRGRARQSDNFRSSRPTM